MNEWMNESSFPFFFSWMEQVHLMRKKISLETSLLARHEGGGREGSRAQKTCVSAVSTRPWLSCLQMATGCIELLLQHCLMACKIQTSKNVSYWLGDGAWESVALCSPGILTFLAPESGILSQHVNELYFVTWSEVLSGQRVTVRMFEYSSRLRW